MRATPHRSGHSRAVLVMATAAILLVALIVALPRRSPPARAGQFRIVCTFLPVYVLTVNLVRDVPNVSVEMLLDPNSGCPHDYSSRPGDLQRVADADLIVANGLGIDDWVENLAKGTKTRIVRISEGIEAIPASGPEHDHDAHAGTEPAEGHHHADSGNPHVWVSPSLAKRQVHTLAEALAQADPPRAESYLRNEPEYADRLSRLATRITDTATRFKNRRIVTFHDAFAYLARDLNLEVVATLAADPEQPPSAGELMEVIERIRATKPAAIFYEPAYGERLARMVGTETGVPIYALNPFNSFPGQPDARSYEQVMEQNVQILQKALGVSP